MTLFKLIFRNVCKNIHDYMIYFLTLMISVSIFYAFNSIQSQKALSDLSATKQLLSDQMGVMISALSVVIAIVLGFLMVYANGFLLKRRKKELGLYMLLGMEKGKISRIFAGETLCIGVFSLVFGLILGVVLSQGLGLLSLRLFQIDMSRFSFIFSLSAMKKTAVYCALIFLVVLIFNVKTVSGVKIIDLLRADRKNETIRVKNRAVQIGLFAVSVLCISASGLIIDKHGLLPSKENLWFQTAAILLAVGTTLLFYSASMVILFALQANKKIYLKGLNVFLFRQIGSKIRIDFIMLTIICLILTVAVGGLTTGISTAEAMNKVSQAACPFDLNVVSEVKVCGETDIAEYLGTKDIDINVYAREREQIGIYDGDFTYATVFEGQDVTLWPIDKAVPECEVMVIAVSDFNKSMELQGKGSVRLDENRFLLNCNYEGTLRYMDRFAQTVEQIELGGVVLYPAGREVLQETYWMTSVGNNDRGTFIVPDNVAQSLKKSMNVLLMQYSENIDEDELLQKLIPISLDRSEGYSYSAKTVQMDMYYGSTSAIVFLVCYIGLIFLLICAAMLSLKQLMETADNISRYRLLQKLGVDSSDLNKALFKQIGVFFIAPLVPAILYSFICVRKIISIVEEFLNLHIMSNSWLTVALLVVVYGGYFVATYFSSKRSLRE